MIVKKEHLIFLVEQTVYLDLLSAFFLVAVKNTFFCCL